MSDFESGAFNRALPPLRNDYLIARLEIYEKLFDYGRRVNALRPSIPAERMDGGKALMIRYGVSLSFAGDLEEEPSAALGFVDPVFEQAGCGYVTGIVA